MGGQSYRTKLSESVGLSTYTVGPESSFREVNVSAEKVPRTQADIRAEEPVEY